MPEEIKLVLSNDRDLLMVKLKNFEKERLKKSHELEIDRHETEILNNFCSLSRAEFHASQEELKQLTRQEFEILIDELNFKVKKRATLQAILKMIGVLSLSIFSLMSFTLMFYLPMATEGTTTHAALWFLSLITTAISIPGLISWSKKVSIHRPYAKSLKYLKNLRGEKYFPLEKLCDKLSIAAKSENENPHTESRSL